MLAKSSIREAKGIQQIQGGRNGDKMGRESADSKLEWDQQPLRETMSFTHHQVCGFGGLLVMGMVILMLWVVRKIRTNLHKAVTLKLS